MNLADSYPCRSSTGAGPSRNLHTLRMVTKRNTQLTGLGSQQGSISPIRLATSRGYQCATGYPLPMDYTVWGARPGLPNLAEARGGSSPLRTQTSRSILAANSIFDGHASHTTPAEYICTIYKEYTTDRGRPIELAVLQFPIAAMLASTRRWFKRNRTPLAIGAGVVGAGYVATQYVLRKLNDARERMSSDRIAKEKYVQSNNVVVVPG